MRIVFERDRQGYPQARASSPWVALGSMLESDLQDDFSIQHALEELRRALGSGSRVEITGNAHTVTVEGENATVACDDDPSLRVSRVPTRVLISLVFAWQSFCARGTPDHWSGDAIGSRGAVEPTTG
jgi:hypothetical protein